MPTLAGQNPFVDANPISRTFGPGVVAPIGVGGHFPQDIAHTPPVDLFNIELQSRDGLTLPGLDGIKGTGDDISLANRFNVPDAFMAPGVEIPAPESYGVQTTSAAAVGRGLATLPGGIRSTSRSAAANGRRIGVFSPASMATPRTSRIHSNARQTSTQRLNSKALEEHCNCAGGVTNHGQSPRRRPAVTGQGAVRPHRPRRHPARSVWPQPTERHAGHRHGDPPGASARLTAPARISYRFGGR
jgi:hypothetical protein